MTVYVILSQSLCGLAYKKVFSAFIIQVRYCTEALVKRNIIQSLNQVRGQLAHNLISFALQSQMFSCVWHLTGVHFGRWLQVWSKQISFGVEEGEVGCGCASGVDESSGAAVIHHRGDGCGPGLSSGKRSFTGGGDWSSVPDCYFIF